METVVKMSAQGQISVPVKIRELLGLKPKDTFVIKADAATGSVNLVRQKTTKEQLAELSELREQYTTSEVRENMAKYKGMTASEIREAWDKSPEGQNYYKEKYFDGN